jgi:phosphatidylserine decarboxylase
MPKTDVPHEENHDVHPDNHRGRVGGWMPADHKLHKEWLGQQVEHARKSSKPLAPVLQEFKDLIETNSRIYMYFTAMFDEVPIKKSVLHRLVFQFHEC